MLNESTTYNVYAYMYISKDVIHFYCRNKQKETKKQKGNHQYYNCSQLNSACVNSWDQKQIVWLDWLLN